MSIGTEDILAVFTINGSIYKENTAHLISKLFFTRENLTVNLPFLSKSLFDLNMKSLSIVSIHKSMDMAGDYVKVHNGSGSLPFLFMEMNLADFISQLNVNTDFTTYNPNTLFIFRDSNYQEIKSLLTNIGGANVDLVRGSSQKAHVLSPLDLRLSTYMLALIGLNYSKLSYFNVFNDLVKEKYLPYSHRIYKKKY
jgi:hypothetical protein